MDVYKKNPTMENRMTVLRYMNDITKGITGGLGIEDTITEYERTMKSSQANADPESYSYAYAQANGKTKKQDKEVDQFDALQALIDGGGR